MKSIYLAGGCFWGIEEYFRRKHGIIKTEVGYANGNIENPSYQQVCSGIASHAETVLLNYDPEIISLQSILDKFFLIMDPTQWMRQGFDVGTQYRNGIYYLDEADLPIINAAMEKAFQRIGKSLVTEVKPLENYYPAEEYHQQYLVKNPGGYCHVDMGK
ncbi:MAG: peptide-methionine (S)-S-oxide reductase MsrA [Tissierellia bacterium]|nr:peptide-methionine (S)-S-oxide reductase MsrA [Tissierellia bacterium]